MTTIAAISVTTSTGEPSCGIPAARERARTATSQSGLRNHVYNDAPGQTLSLSSFCLQQNVVESNCTLAKELLAEPLNQKKAMPLRNFEDNIKVQEREISFFHPFLFFPTVMLCCTNVFPSSNPQCKFYMCMSGAY